LPMPIVVLKIIRLIDNFLCKISPSFFALQRQVVLEKLI
jgi:hypothetical protein